MLLVVLLLVSKAGAMCVGGPQELRTGEVLVMCPLSEDARLSKLDVVIGHLLNHDQPIPDTMLGCVWPKRNAHKPVCRSHFHFTLASLQKDCVMARMPRAQLHKDGFYQSQLVPPPDEDHAFNICLVYDNDDTEDPSSTISPVISSTANDLRHPRNDKEKVSTGADGGSPRGNSAVGVALTVVLVIHSMLIAGLFPYIFLLHRRHWQHVQRASENPQDLQQKLRIIAKMVAEIDQERAQQSRRTVSQMSENLLDMYMDMLSIYGTTPTALRRTVPRTSETSLEKEQQPLMRTVPRTSETSLEKEQQPLMRTVPRTSETSLEKEQQPLMRTVPRTSETSLEKEQQPLMRTVPRTSETSMEKKTAAINENGATDVRDLHGEENSSH